MESLYNKVGITTEPQPGTVLLGIDANGRNLYGNPTLANDATPDVAPRLAENFQTRLNQIGAATKEDNDHLDNLKEVVKDPETVKTLDLHRAANNKTEFGKMISRLVGAKSDQTNAAYDAWGVMSPNQKTVSLLHIGGKEDDLYNREFLPGVNTKTALDLQEKGVPMKSVKGNWGQIDALHKAIGHEGDNVSAILRAARSNQLGPVQNLTDQDEKFYGTRPAPQYGIGALELPASNNIPKGYTVAGQVDGKQIIIPQGNEASVAFNPKFNGPAGAVYSKWKDAGVAPALNGSKGGSNMYKTLTTLYDTNPKALGKALDFQIPGKEPFTEKVNGLTLSVLTKGTPTGTKAINNDATLKELGVSGIQSKEIGYKLANQAYAEGRINDSHLFAIQRNLDELFDKDAALSHIAPSDQFNVGTAFRPLGENRG